MADHQLADTHSSHDLELIARAVAGDLAAGEAIAARDLVAACRECAVLADDIRSIVAATRDLGAAASLAVYSPAPRDFRLTEADATRLRRGGFLGLGRFRASTGVLGRSLGGALVALGLVGLLVSAAVPSLFGGPVAEPRGPGAGAAAPEAAGSLTKESGGAPQPPAPVATQLNVLALPVGAAGAASSGAAGAAGAAGATPAPATGGVTGDAGEAGAADNAGAAGSARATAVPTTGLLVILGSAACVVAGLALLLVARVGRRAGP